MVLSASTADEGQAGRPAWLERLAGILELAREGVIVLVPNARPAQLLPLMRALWDIDEQARVIVEADTIAHAGVGDMIVLALRECDAVWLNRNRPIFAQRKLRVVVWSDADVTASALVTAPDFFDWVSHVLECPFAVPGFTLRGLELGSSWYPGIVWKGGLELGDVLEHLGVAHVTASAHLNQSGWVEWLRARDGKTVCVAGLASNQALWQLRWALAETRFAGRVILDKPELDTPGWIPVDAKQLALGELEPERRELALRLEGEASGLELALELGLRPIELRKGADLDRQMLDAVMAAPSWLENARMAVSLQMSPAATEQA